MKFLYIFLASFSLSVSASTVIYSSTYIDVINLTEINDHSIVIDGNKIIAIEAGFIQLSKEDTLIDLRGMTLMPGFMDMHVHFGQEYLSKAERPAKVERETSAIMATSHALKTLKAGFTTVRQVGDSGMVAISLRDTINSGKLLDQEYILQVRVLLLLAVMQTQLMALVQIVTVIHQLKMVLLMVHMMPILQLGRDIKTVLMVLN